MAEITYRNLAPDDAGALHRIASDWSVVRQLGGWPWPPDPAFTASRAVPYADLHGPGFVWGINRDARLIGTVGVTGGVLGYMLSADAHAQGLGTRAARDAVGHAFDSTGLARIDASTWHDNPASYRLLQKLGFVHWQTNFVHAKARGVPTLCHLHRLGRQTWLRLRDAAQ